MFQISNIFFLLMQTADEFSRTQQQKLIVPGIIFSVGAIMLIVCVLVSNIQRKRKLAVAEKQKRERIKKFSEEANMRYAPSSSDDILRQRRITTESIPSQNTYATTSPRDVMQQVKIQTTEQQRTQTVSAVPVMPSIPQTNIQTPNIPNVPSTPSMPASPQVANAQVPNVPSTPQPSMGSAPLPGMSGGYVGEKTSDSDSKENIADMVRKRIQEIEEQKRENLSKEESNMPLPIAKPQDNNIKPQMPIENETKKEETKKEFKFEYKPEYKPGQEPDKKEEIKEPSKEVKEETKEKIKEEVKEDAKETSKEEKNDEVNKVENEIKENIKNESNENKKENEKENKEDSKIEEQVTTLKIKTISIDGDEETKEEKDEESKNSASSTLINKAEPTLIEIPKVAKVQTEHSAEFIKAAEDEQVVVLNKESELEVQKQIERAPQVPKITSKKIEYNVGFLREVQSKLNASREYEEAIQFKQEEKEKLKEELLEKRMNLDKVKTRLQEEVNKKEQDKIEIAKEEISKSLLENTEKGITYEEGKKISLFEQLDETLTPINEENDKLQKVKEEVKPQIELPKEEKNDEVNKVETEIKEKVENEETKKTIEVKKEIREETKEISTEKKDSDREKQKTDVVNNLDKLFDAMNDEDKLDNEKNEKISKQQRNEKLKQIVDKVKIGIAGTSTVAATNMVNNQTIKSTDDILNSKPKASSEEIQKVISNINSLTQNQNTENHVEEKTSDDINEDLIKNKIKKIALEEKKRKEELLRQEQLEKEEKIRQREEANKKTKSILNGIDVESEIISKNSKRITSFNDAPTSRKIITVISPESCGKTTVAVNLAYELANRGLKVCLIDTDNIKKDVYYYIHQEYIGCLSKLQECEQAEDMYKLGIKVNDRLTAFTENKGIEYELNYSKLYKLIAYAQSQSDAVIIDIKQTLGQEKVKELLKLSSNVLFVIDKKITTLNRIAEKFAKVKGGFLNKDITVVVNMDEGRGINKSAVKSIFKHLEYIENGEKKSYSIKVGEIFTICYDTKSIITGLISQEPAVVVSENKIIGDIKKIASHFYENKN